MNKDEIMNIGTLLFQDYAMWLLFHHCNDEYDNFFIFNWAKRFVFAQMFIRDNYNNVKYYPLINL